MSGDDNRLDRESAGQACAPARLPVSRFRRALRHLDFYPRRRIGLLFADSTPLDFRILGRTLIHAALIGLACGLMAAAFFASLEGVQHILLERLAGYVPLRAHGETVISGEAGGVLRPWLLIALPAVGALLGSLVGVLAPEVRGGGGDAAIEAFHHQGGVIRRRVAPLKALASILTLGLGGSGGREGPTMQIGAAIGSWVGRVLRVSARERRILLVAGIAAGISGVFRTPLGAALLAVEILYRDDFETEALVPAILSSVLSYSVVISIFGESKLFAPPPHHPFVPSQLPLHLLLAVLISIVALLFLGSLKLVRRTSARLPMPVWLRPAVGGALLGTLAVVLIETLGADLGRPGRGLGILGGGYGLAQAAISGGDWLPHGWRAVELLLFLGVAKLVAASLTIGTGGSAGDFAPSLVIGAVFGGAFGRAAQLLLGDPSIEPGAFALVGMGAFYGGVAHVPVSALILVSEMAGSYDLLVPSMLAVGCAFVILRKHSLYTAQLPSRRDPAADSPMADLRRLEACTVGEVFTPGGGAICFEGSTPAASMSVRAALAPDQGVFPVIAPSGQVSGLIRPEALRHVGADADSDAGREPTAAELMEPAVAVRVGDDVRRATELMLENGLRALPVVDVDGRFLGLIDEAEVARVYLEASGRAKPAAPTGAVRSG